MTDNPNDRKISETPGAKDVLDEAAEQIEKAWREKLLRETADLKTENALLRAQLDEFNRKLVEARDRNERLEADCNERVAFIEEKFELDTASIELENNELHAASVRYLADARELSRQVVQLHAEAEAMSDEIERLRVERDAALKAQAELSDALLAQRDLMAEVAALKDRLAASERRATVAEAKVEVMTKMRGE
ncbi:hypothetical protein DW661_04000 [Collinsella sp. AM24-1]|jgi:chromosome segregation ATPase|uniref:hypothetical protein n=1 Tax=unclassified Collinsella TaxID=2637548 RepID=UPI000E42DB1B|nr:MULTISPECIES: hypothetical protein [unclassified Collinsella]RGJ83758.1 hypothetical protein DXD42_05690 [Collinsella sp. TM04-9]RGJ92114.1 hypothetical protein DXD39_09280 [Collinsella sp. TM04-29]RGK62007.1 hypothetical protein DXC99_06720 [Collinsella sp. TF10-11AT]RGX50206.1 hypothetical protein DWV20_09210 [Collinsella sp. AF02-46-1]RHC32748.1 hypothetical protein DW850_03380 [Collinsella sp. AM36-4AA]